MKPPSSSSPRRYEDTPQAELEQIASLMELDKQADVDADESDVDAKSGDEDGPMVGQGAWIEAGGTIRLIHTLFRKENAVQWRRLIRITNRNNDM